MDEPSGVAGASHRRFRHGLEDLPTAIQTFGEKYGAETVENIFLDHLKADSEEERKNKEIVEDSSLSPKFWTKEQDKYLIDNRNLSNEELEERPLLRGKTKSDISKRRKYLGIIQPRVQRYKHERLVGLFFRLEKGQKLYMHIKVKGGNNDIKFGVTEGKMRSRRLGERTVHDDSYMPMIVGEKDLVYTARLTGSYSFNFSNKFSWKTSKLVEVTWHLENGSTFGQFLAI